MAIGERIRFFRNLRGMTQKYLGTVVGFPEKTADIRMAQYESGSRTPKADLTNKLAKVFDISPQALSVPDIDSYIGLMHTLFTLEDRYGLTIEKTENGISMYADPKKGTDAAELSEMLNAWAEQSEKYHNGDINRDEYDKWRYNYPKYDETSGYIKVPSQEVNEAMLEAFKDKLKND
ncbi:helix-turn-helix domain-containing protein [uncultured Ruminococcus sp.]|uniref:helix-turn-helix domain-containing protein n=1 Tax=uncultured Ruminococcus sp. TaxID=165186 RepID=UPI0026704432|nr:helix-turn-helix transcriptional regulator [uncultured Ruminococcus sp.]